MKTLNITSQEDLEKSVRRKQDIVKRIISLPKLTTENTLKEALAWSNKNPEHKPHFIRAADGVFIIQ